MSSRGARITVPLLAAAASGHVLYPAAVWLAASRRAQPQPPVPERWPSLSMIVPAYKEAAIIADKVVDLRANRYPGRWRSSSWPTTRLPRPPRPPMRRSSSPPGAGSARPARSTWEWSVPERRKWWS